MLQNVDLNQIKQYNASLKQYKDKAASLNAEIADSVVYTAGAGLKFSHQKNADIEAGVVYAASENTNDVTFHVNGSYQF